ncbi:MAG: hypothetical protein AUK50_03285 [Comamonadaceae bacterium CG2_30_57_122]|nr:MAG: hypothetical protein AUK50_03285 [Comamonadaceae bacterium CG2_30_57_122]
MPWPEIDALLLAVETACEVLPLTVASYEKAVALGGCRTFGIEAFSKSGVAKFDPSEGSFCRICWLIAVAMGQKDGKK